MRRCPLCDEVKAADAFYVDRKRADALHTYCKACCKLRAKARYAADPESQKARHRAWVAKNRDRVALHKIKAAYGLSAEEYAALPKVCTICGETNDLRVDHSHQSGRVRGVLCDRCNKGLGFFRDNPALLERAASYVLGGASAEIFSLRCAA